MTTSWRVRDHLLSVEQPLVMGIINVTPDSFSDGGDLRAIDDAVARAETLVAEGADLLDIGGESTRPRARAISLDEELQRVMPLIRALVQRLPAIPLSIDTVKSGVAAAAIREGVQIVNDVSGMRLDPDMAGVCAESSVGVVITHSRGDVSDMATYAHANYDNDPMDAVLSELRARVETARAQGVQEDRIVVDPGIGFAKHSEHSLRVIGALSRLVDWGYPVLVGLSRKRFIGELSGVTVASERVHGSVGGAVAAFDRGARIFRVHDVAATRQALNVAAAIRLAGAS